jgi:cysteine desulfurase
VLLAMGIPPERAHGALRLTAGRGTTPDDVDRAGAVLGAAIGRMRAGLVAESSTVAPA